MRIVVGLRHQSQRDDPIQRSAQRRQSGHGRKAPPVGLPDVVHGKLDRPGFRARRSGALEDENERGDGPSRAAPGTTPPQQTAPTNPASSQKRAPSSSASVLWRSRTVLGGPATPSDPSPENRPRRQRASMRSPARRGTSLRFPTATPSAARRPGPCRCWPEPDAEAATRQSFKVLDEG